MVKPMRRLVFVLLAILASWCWADEPVVIRMMSGGMTGMPAPEATTPQAVARRAVFEEFHRQNPDIRVENAGGLELQGDLAESGFLMSMAGDTAPDVFYVNFRQYYNYVDQGFCLPLDDFVAANPQSLARVNPIVLDVIQSYDGQIYALPFFQVAQALYFRKDHFLEAGLDPSQPPRTWDEFIEVGRKLTEAAPGRNGFVFSAGLGGKAYWWTNFAWQAGAEVVEPAERGFWRAAIATEEGATALDFFRRLTLETWTGEDGETYGPIAKVSGNWGEDVTNGNVSMWFSYTQDIVMSSSDLNPALVGIAAMPAGPAGAYNEINAGMWAINATVTDPDKLEAAWRFIEFFVGADAAKVSTDRFVEQGLGNMVNPALLQEFGYEDLLAGVDPAYVEANTKLFERGKPEPYGRNTQQVYTVLDAALDRAILEPDTPALTILQDVSAEMDRKLLGFVPEEEMRRMRGWFAGVGGLTTIALIGALVWWWRRMRGTLEVGDARLVVGQDRKRVWRFMFWCLIPAAGSIALWSYYPLAAGLVIAFQDYKIVEESAWVGVDNFVAVFTQPIFYKSLWNSFLYVGLSILLGFLLPIFLALALNEIPKAKVLFRTLFYLPAMTSPIVIAFLWRQFYDKSPDGLLNSVLAPFINSWNTVTGWFGATPLPVANDWLGDPRLAMFAVVLPGVWAGAGPGSILYLAALKSLPEERFEAADLDGANWWQKVVRIVMPGLRPLILINLLGVFIAGFKAMENVFVMTGGGPLYATHTIGLEVWTNAFMFLKFGYATAAAWVMGAILIGFTAVQIRSLTQMKFTAGASKI